MYCALLLGLVFLSFSTADIVTTSDVTTGECVGSITLHTGEKTLKFTEGVEELEESVTVEKAVLEGCGDCFRLFKKKNGRGKSYFVNRRGEHTITMGKVRSIRKVSCSNMAMPMWAVIIIVLIIVMVVGMGTVMGVKRCRKYDGVQTGQV